jgi:hypothetical protein
MVPMLGREIQPWMLWLHQVVVLQVLAVPGTAQQQDTERVEEWVWSRQY